MSITLKSGASTDLVSVDQTSKAIRASIYNSDGSIAENRTTYRASNTTTTAVVAGTAPFFILYGSATRTVKVRRVFYTGTVGVAAVNVPVVLAKYSTAPTGGTPSTLTQVPLDSGNGTPATLSLCQLYTSAPTAGTLVGALEVKRGLHNITGAVATVDFLFDYRNMGILDSQEPIVLNGITEGIALFYATTPGNATAVNVWCEWTEE